MGVGREETSPVSQGADMMNLLIICCCIVIFSVLSSIRYGYGLAFQELIIKILTLIFFNSRIT